MKQESMTEGNNKQLLGKKFKESSDVRSQAKIVDLILQVCSKNFKETILKELKECKRMISHQIETINKKKNYKK